MMRPPQYLEGMNDGKRQPIDKSQFQVFAERKCYTNDDSEYKIEHHRLFLKFAAVLIIPSTAFFVLSEVHNMKKPQLTISPTSDSRTALCAQTCTITIVESIPENVTFGSMSLPESTFNAWNSLIRSSKSNLLIAAYKSSLRGKHVFGSENSQLFSTQGEKIFDSLLESGTEKGVFIRIVENYPPKDKGDNEDAASLEKRGAVRRRHLNFQKILGKGTMHSKFIVSDKTSFYLGSANLDWRSLNQKMELGVIVKECPCLAEDLSNVFDAYWELSSDGTATLDSVRRVNQREASYKD
uniref:PLD phosphodiesterase domain-containing protein n=3 Tax=Parascaris univalens TaxID=6257 RepID=A0A915A651_PARUN